MIFREGGEGLPANSAKENSVKKQFFFGPKTPSFAFFHTFSALLVYFMAFLVHFKPYLIQKHHF